MESLSTEEKASISKSVSEQIEKRLGVPERAVIRAAISCVRNGYTKEQTSAELATLVDKDLSVALADDIDGILNTFIKKRSIRKIVRRRPQAEGIISESGRSSVSAAESTKNDEINSVISNVKMQIEARKQSLATAVSTGKIMTLKDLQKRYLENISGKSHTAALMQAQIEQHLIQKQKNEDFSEEHVEEGSKTVGEASVKPSKRLSKQEQMEKMFQTPVPRKIPKVFSFNTPGKFVRLAQTMRTKEKLERLQQQIESSSKRTGIASAAKLAVVTMKHESGVHSVPEIEWWDSIFLPFDSYSSVITEVKQYGGDIKNIRHKFIGITNLVEHPIERPPADEPETVTLPTFLTDRERVKIRKQRRRMKELEKREKIRVGLVEPAPPKVKITNLMRVLSTEAVQDPTKVEAHVREQAALRKKAHEDANEARKLTDDQKRAKNIRKMKEDTSLGVQSAVYRILDLGNPAKRFKVDKNAQQLFMTGCILIMVDMTLVIVEGGPKAHNKFKRLMNTRIKWKEDIVGSCNTHHARNKPKDGTEKYNKCTLIWEGINKKRYFNDWKIHQVTTDALAREFMAKNYCEHYWDLAYTISLDEESK